MKDLSDSKPGVSSIYWRLSVERKLVKERKEGIDIAITSLDKKATSSLPFNMRYL